MTGQDKYSLHKRDNLQQPFQMQLSQKEDIFSEFFLAFLLSTLNLERFTKKEEPHSWFFSEIKDDEKGV